MTIKYCPVMPPKAIKQLEGIPNIGYFCYADVASRDEDYLMFFDGRQHILLDCPIMEQGKIVEPSVFDWLCTEIRPKFAIIPDIQFDKFKTLRMFETYFEGRDCDAGVLQGTKKRELVGCGLAMLEMGVKRLGVPRTNRMDGTPRSEIIMELREVWGSSFEVHLLGANYPYSDERLCSQEHLAQSLDTAEPVNAAINKKHIRSKTVNRASDFLTKEGISQYYLEANIGEMSGWLK